MRTQTSGQKAHRLQEKLSEGQEAAPRKQTVLSEPEGTGKVYTPLLQQEHSSPASSPPGSQPLELGFAPVGRWAVVYPSWAEGYTICFFGCETLDFKQSPGTVRPAEGLQTHMNQFTKYRLIYPLTCNCLFSYKPTCMCTPSYILAGLLIPPWENRVQYRQT